MFALLSIAKRKHAVRSTARPVVENEDSVSMFADLSWDTALCYACGRSMEVQGKATIFFDESELQRSTHSHPVDLAPTRPAWSSDDRRCCEWPGSFGDRC